MKKIMALVMLLALLLPACALATDISSTGSSCPKLTNDSDVNAVVTPTIDQGSCLFVYELSEGSYTLSGAVEKGWGLDILVQGDVTLTLNNVTITSISNALFFKKKPDSQYSVTLELKGKNTLTNKHDAKVGGNTALYSQHPMTIQGDGSLTLIGEECGEHDGNCAFFEQSLTLLTKNIKFIPKGSTSYALTVWGSLTCGDGFGILEAQNPNAYWEEMTGGTADYAEVADRVTVRFQGTQNEEIAKNTVLAGGYLDAVEWNGQLPAGKMFSHWLSEDGTTVEARKRVVVEKDTVFTPVFEKPVTITYLDTDGSIYYLTRVPLDTVVEMPVGVYLLKDGKRIVAWKESGCGIVLEGGKSFYADRDMTFMPVTETAPLYTITFKDGEKTVYTEKTWAHDYYLGKDLESTQNKRHIGWQCGDKKYYLFSHMELTQDTTLTAIWEDDSSSPRLPSTKVTMVDEVFGTYEWACVYQDFYTYVNPVYSLEDGSVAVLSYQGKTYGRNDLMIFNENEATVYVSWEKPEVIRIPAALPPQTGDSSSLAPWLVLMGLAGAGILMLRRKARK